MKFISTFFLLLSLNLTSWAQDTHTHLVDYVNPFIGTGGTGHTFPGATLPHGMVQLSPDTRVEGWESCAGYYYPDNQILGFSHTHLSGTGVPDLGDILVLPISNKPNVQHYKNGKPYIKARIDKVSEKASPGYYKVNLPDEAIQVELSCTDRVGWHKYSYTKAHGSVFVDLQHRDQLIDSKLNIVNDKELTGFRISRGWARRQHVYFVMQFSRPVELVDSMKSDITKIFRIKDESLEPLIVKVGISAVSIEGARKNLIAEAPGWDFEAVKAKASATWEKELAKIEVKGKNHNDMVNFYTALYHVNIAPNVFCDVDSMYRAMDDKTYKAKDFVPYTVFSIWDTYRAAHPLFTIIDRKRTLDYIKTMLDHYQKAGHLPVWELDGNETWCMIGYHAVSVIADAYIKGIRDFDANLALEAMQSFATSKRFGIDHYVKDDYLAADVEGESVSKTLEYAYDDWCIAQMARAMGKQEVYTEYIKRAQYYKNLLDPKSTFMRPKADNHLLEPFSPTEINMHFTEANSWQYSFYVPQDVENFKRYLGGNKGMESKLDQLFSTTDKLSGRDQSDVTGLIGQYAHGNEPSHHITYMYNYCGAAYKTQKLTRQICKTMYLNDAENGLCGNEDCGQMSAWYILSSLGLYQLSPGNDYYDITTPLFDESTINLENGKKFKITTNANDDNSNYIQDISVAGRNMNRSYILYDEIRNGMSLKMNLGSAANKTLWTEETAHAPSNIKDAVITPLPFVSSGNTVFVKAVNVELEDLENGANLFYSIDQDSPKSSFIKYTKAFSIDKSCKLYYYAVLPKTGDSKIISTSFRKIDDKLHVLGLSEYSTQYTGGGKFALFDGIRGSNDYKSLAWQGYEGNDLVVNIDLGELKSLSEIGLGVLQDQGAWIFYPKYLEVMTSEDGTTYKPFGRADNNIDPLKDGRMIQDLLVKGSVKAKYIKLKAASLGIIPSGHEGAGSKAWIFADEVIIR